MKTRYIPTPAEIATFKLGVKEAHGAMGVTYDNDPTSPRSVAYDWGRNIGEIDATGPSHWKKLVELAPELALMVDTLIFQFEHNGDECMEDKAVLDRAQALLARIK